MREFIKLPPWAWAMVGSLSGWLLGAGIVRLVKADAPLSVALALLLSGTALLALLYIHRAQGLSPRRRAEKRSEEAEKRWEHEAYQRELEDRRREYEAHLRREYEEDRRRAGQRGADKSPGGGVPR